MAVKMAPPTSSFTEIKDVSFVPVQNDKLQRLSKHLGIANDNIDASFDWSSAFIGVCLSFLSTAIFELVTSGEYMIHAVVISIVFGVVSYVLFRKKKTSNAKAQTMLDEMADDMTDIFNQIKQQEND